MKLFDIIVARCLAVILQKRKKSGWVELMRWERITTSIAMDNDSDYILLVATRTFSLLHVLSERTFDKAYVAQLQGAFET